MPGDCFMKRRNVKAISNNRSFSGHLEWKPVNHAMPYPALKHYDAMNCALAFITSVTYSITSLFELHYIVSHHGNNISSHHDSALLTFHHITSYHIILETFLHIALRYCHCLHCLASHHIASH